MIRDITLGQYFPGDSAVHRLDPRMKIVLTCAYMVALFAAANAWGLLLSVLFLVLPVALSRVPFKLMLRGVRPLIPIILITSLINVFTIEGKPLFPPLGPLVVSDKGLATAVFMSVRIILLILGTSLLTYTTSPIALTDGLERLMKPLSYIRVPVHELSMMMTIALRFIPTLIEETDKIISAQKARGADFETGSLLQRMRALVPVLVPLFVSAFRRAGELALAMDCRCYRGGEGRTRLRTLRFGPGDWVACAILTLLITCVITLNFLLKPLI